MDNENIFVVLTYHKSSRRRRRNSKITPPGDWLSLRKTTDNAFNLTFYKNTMNESKDMEFNYGYFVNNYHGEKL